MISMSCDMPTLWHLPSGKLIRSGSFSDVETAFAADIEGADGAKVVAA
jgi:hypothetical protein